jgi:hypothetical protein
MRIAVVRIEGEDLVVHTMTVHGALVGVGRFLEHAAAVVVGLILMIVGLGLGVTMIMLPVGIAVGLLGVAMVVGGMFARIDERS